MITSVTSDLVRLWRRADGVACYARKRPAREERADTPRWELLVRRPNQTIIKAEKFHTFSLTLRASTLWRADFAVAPEPRLMGALLETIYARPMADRDAGDPGVGDGGDGDPVVGDAATGTDG